MSARKDVTLFVVAKAGEPVRPLYVLLQISRASARRADDRRPKSHSRKSTLRAAAALSDASAEARDSIIYCILTNTISVLGITLDTADWRFVPSFKLCDHFRMCALAFTSNGNADLVMI